MAFFASIKKGLESNVEFLRNERGFFADVAYAINETLADLTPDTTYGSTTDHFKMAAQSLGETVQAAGVGIKHALWDEKNEFVERVVEKSGVENPLGQAGLATFYTGFYYLKAFTYDAVVNTAKGFYQSAQAIANGKSTEETLLGVSQLYGSIGAAAGMVAGVGGAGHIASKIGPTTFIVPMLNGSEVALAAVTIPTGALVAAAMPGGIGTVMMAAQDQQSEGGKKGDSDEPIVKTGEELRAELKRRGILQKDLAEALGVVPAAVANWISRGIPKGQLSRINAVLQGRAASPAMAAFRISPLQQQLSRDVSILKLLPKELQEQAVHINLVQGSPNKLIVITQEGKVFEVTLEASVRQMQ